MSAYVEMNTLFRSFVEPWFFYSQYGFRSFSTADYMSAVAEKIARTFNMSGATWAETLQVSTAFDSVWHAGLFQKLISFGIFGWVFGFFLHFSVIDVFVWSRP